MAGTPTPQAVQRAAARRHAVGAARTRARVLRLAGQAHDLRARDWLGAARRADEAARLAAICGGDEVEAAAWCAQAACRLEASRIPEGLQLARRALLAATRAGDRPLMLRCLFLITYAHLDRGRLVPARAPLRRAGALAKSIGSPAALAQRADAAGLAFLLAGRLAMAERAFENSLRLARIAGLRELEAVTLSELGMVAGRRGEAELALERTRAALDICRAEGFRRLAILYTGNFTDNLLLLGRLREARDALRRMLGEVRGLREVRTRSCAHCIAAELLARLGEPAAALAQAERAIRFGRRAGERRVEALGLLIAARARIGLGAPAAAGPLLREARALVEEERLREFRGELEVCERLFAATRGAGE